MQKKISYYACKEKSNKKAVEAKQYYIKYIHFCYMNQLLLRISCVFWQPTINSSIKIQNFGHSTSGTDSFSLSGQDATQNENATAKIGSDFLWSELKFGRFS